MTQRGGLAALLIVDGRRRPLRVTLLGRALCISGEGLPETLQPVTRIDRVAVFGDVTLSSEALRALAEADRPLAILDGRGHVLAVVRAIHRPRTGMVEALDRLALRRDWINRLGDWKRARIARRARGIVTDTTRAARSGGAVASSMLSFGRAISRTDGGPGASPLAAAAKSHARLTALAALARAGVPDRWTGGGGDSARNLIPIFAEVALWVLVGLMRRPDRAEAVRRAIESDTRAGCPGIGPATAAVLRAAEAPLRAALADELHLFHAWLLEVVAPGTIPEEDFPWPG